MFARVGHPDAKLATARVKIERARLEHSLVAAGVKVAERHEVVQEREKVAMIAHELVHGCNRVGFRFEGLVPGNECRDVVLGWAGENFADALDAEFFRVRADFAGEPGFVRSEPGEERSPIGLSQDGFLAEQRFRRRRLQRGKRAGPRGVDAFVQRQRLARLDARERETGNLARRYRHLLGRDRKVLGFLTVDGGEGACVERGQPAAGEIIVHFGFDGAHGAGRGCSRFTHGQNVGVTFRLFPPVGERLGLGEKLVRLRLVDARLAAAVGFRAQTGDDFIENHLRRLVAASTGMMPSPLKRVCAKILAVSVVSSTLMAGQSCLPRLVRICFAEARSCRPSAVLSLMALNGSAGEDFRRSSGFLSRLVTHFAAAMTSGARRRPSLSVSISASVFVSNWMPVAGQASATQSFWSS